MSGSLGDKALLVIDGTPRSVAVGATCAGVKLVSVTGNDAVVEVKGKRVTLHLGGAQVNLGGKPERRRRHADRAQRRQRRPLLHRGSINGKAVRFLVDTGATNVSMSAGRSR